MLEIKTLQDVEKLMKDVNKALSLIESTYGKQGPVCYAISQFLKSDNGKAELGETSAKAWLTERLKGVSVNAFYNAVRRYEESLLTPEEKETKKATKIRRVNRNSQKVLFLRRDIFHRKVYRLALKRPAVPFYKNSAHKPRP